MKKSMNNNQQDYVVESGAISVEFINRVNAYDFRFGCGYVLGKMNVAGLALAYNILGAVLGVGMYDRMVENFESPTLDILYVVACVGFSLLSALLGIFTDYLEAKKYKRTRRTFLTVLASNDGFLGTFVGIRLVNLMYNTKDDSWKWYWGTVFLTLIVIFAMEVIRAKVLPKTFRLLYDRTALSAKEEAEEIDNDVSEKSRLTRATRVLPLSKSVFQSRRRS